MMLTPYKRYRPTRVKDDQGGFTETLGTSVTVYASIIYQDNEPRMTVRRNTDLRKGDLIEVASQKYRVLLVQKQDGTDAASVSLEKVVKPI